MNIRAKINASFLTAFVLVTAFIGIAIGLYTSQIVKNNAYSYLHSSGRARAEHIRTYIRDQKKLSEMLAAASVYRDFLNEPTDSEQYPVIKKKISDRFIRTMETDPQLVETLIIDKYGKTLASSNPSEEGSDESQDDYFIQGLKQTYIKDVYILDDYNRLTYAIASPINDANGVALGVSVLRYDSEDFYGVVDGENVLGNTEENFIINRDYFFITPSRFLGNSVILKQKVETKNARDCFDPAEMAYVTKNGYSGLIESFGSQLVEAKDYRNVNVIATHDYIPETGWCLITKADRTDVLSYRATLIAILLGIFLGAGAIFLLIGLMLSKRIADPIKSLTVSTHKFESGDYSYRTNIKTKDEIGGLSSALDKMAKVVNESRLNIEKRVADQTKTLNTKTKDLELQQQAILNILEDVEAEKDKSEKLAGDLEKFKLALENASDQAVISDPDGTVIYGNKAIETITGYKPEEALGKKAGALWGNHMPLEYYQNMWDVIKNQKRVFISEIQNVRKNGQIYTANISIAPLLDKDDNILYYVAIQHDITKEKEVDRVKTEFISLASHQLRTPLSSINWYTEMLLAGDAGPISKDQKTYLEEVYKGNQRMVDLVNALLNVSRMELGTFIIEPVPTDLVKLAQDVIAEQKPTILSKKLKVIETHAPKIPQINVDPKLIRMVFQNLLSNAVKYTPDKGQVTLDLGLLKRGQKIAKQKIPKDSVGLVISDTGYGIPKAQQEKIFTKLFRADNVREKDTEGTGLGLYIVKDIVDHSGGMIWFESEENKGTTFYVTLPLAGMKRKTGTKMLE